MEKSKFSREYQTRSTNLWHMLNEILINKKWWSIWLKKCLMLRKQNPSRFNSLSLFKSTWNLIGFLATLKKNRFLQAYLILQNNSSKGLSSPLYHCLHTVCQPIFELRTKKTLIKIESKNLRSVSNKLLRKVLERK